MQLARRASRATTGVPNGRRLDDDIIDVAVRVVEGVLLPGHPRIVDSLGDGVNANDLPFQGDFPYVAYPTHGSTPTPLTQEGIEQMGAIGGVRVRDGSRSGAGPSAPMAGGRRPRRALRAALTAAGVVALAVALLAAGSLGLFGGASGNDESTSPILGNDPGAALAGHPVVLSGSLQQAVASLQERLRDIPEDWASWATLGLATSRRAASPPTRATTRRPRERCGRSLKLQPDENFEAATGRAPWRRPGTTSPAR